jgi:hypothetical protein
MAQYMLMCCRPEVDPADKAEGEAALPMLLELHRNLREAGILLDVQRLRSAESATSVRVRDGRTEITDGPFAVTKEFLAGYYLVECADLDEAIKVAVACPVRPTGRSRCARSSRWLSGRTRRSKTRRERRHSAGRRGLRRRHAYVPAAPEGDRLVGEELCAQATRLGELLPDVAEAWTRRMPTCSAGRVTPPEGAASAYGQAIALTGNSVGPEELERRLRELRGLLLSECEGCLSLPTADPGRKRPALRSVQIAARAATSCQGRPRAAPSTKGARARGPSVDRSPKGVFPMIAEPMAAQSTHRHINAAGRERAPRSRRATARVLRAIAIRVDPAVAQKPQPSGVLSGPFPESPRPAQPQREERSQ